MVNIHQILHFVIPLVVSVVTAHLAVLAWFCLVGILVGLVEYPQRLCRVCQRTQSIFDQIFITTNQLITKRNLGKRVRVDFLALIFFLLFWKTRTQAQVVMPVFQLITTVLVEEERS